MKETKPEPLCVICGKPEDHAIHYAAIYHDPPLSAHDFRTAAQKVATLAEKKSD